MLLVIFLFLFFEIAAVKSTSLFDCSLIIEVDQGKLIGKDNKNILTGKPYYSFQGIPYGKPPVGDLRFQPPAPAEEWEETYDATFERNDCIQLDYFQSKSPVGKEDCLFLNIYTPEVPKDVKTPKAVMVYIHGGGFFIGSGSEKLYSADFLMTHDIVYVSFNYRLHVFGFLNLGLPGCLGNAGLKDQLLALKWIKKNIAKFGGDPDNITIFGESAGGSSVHYHIMSPLSKGLFTKGIMQSGSALSPWAFSHDPYRTALEFGYKLGFIGYDKEKLLDFLKKQKDSDLTTAVIQYFEELKYRSPGSCNSLPFLPSVEKIKENAFLPDLPEKLSLTSSPIPIIYGSNDKEGLLSFYSLGERSLLELENDFDFVLKHNFKMDPALVPEFSKKVKQYYFGDKKIGKETLGEIVDLYTDLFFYRFYEAIEFVTNSSLPPYVYEFAHNGIFNTFKQILVDKDYTGAAHGDELGYLFYPRFLIRHPPIEGDDLKVIKNMTKMWTDFAKTGKPCDDSIWKPSTEEKPVYLRIEADLKLKEGKVYGKRLQFLKDLLGPMAQPQFLFH